MSAYSRNFLKDNFFMQALIRQVDADNWQKEQDRLASFNALGHYNKLFKEAGCTASLLTSSVGGNNEARQWVAVTGTADQVAAFFWDQSADSEIDCFLDQAVPLDQQFPLNQNAPLIPKAFASAIENHDRQAFLALSTAEQEVAHGKWSLINRKRDTVWHLGGGRPADDVKPGISGP